MEHVHAVVAGFTARQHGAVTRAQLVASGVKPDHVDRLVRLGVLVPVHRGVYRHAAVPFDRDLRWMAAVLAGGDGAALSHRAAAVLHGFDLRRSRPEILIPHDRRLVLDDVTVHRSRRLEPVDLVQVRGITTTARPRTLLELGAVLRGERYESVVQDAIIRRLVTIEALLAVVERIGGHGKTGTVALRAALLDGLVDESVESPLELVLARIVGAADVPRPVRQYELRCTDGRLVRFDNAWPEIQVGLDADGRRWHGSATQARRTRDRSRSIVRSDWLHLVYGWAECVETPDAVRREIEETVLARLRSAA